MVSNLAYTRAIGERGAELAKDKTNLGCDLAIRRKQFACYSLHENSFGKVDDQPLSLPPDLSMVASNSPQPYFCFECGDIDHRDNERDVVSHAVSC